MTLASGFGKDTSEEKFEMSGNDKIKQQLLDLGLEVDALGEPEALERAREDSSKGFVRGEALDMATLDDALGTYIPSNAADRAGFDLKRYDVPGARVIELFHESGADIELMPQPTTDTVWRDEEGFLRLDLARAEHDLIVARAPGEGSALVFQRTRDDFDDFTVQFVETRGVVLDIPDVLAPPVEEWLAGSEDASLVDELKELHEVAGELGALIAAGAIARFMRASKQDREAALQKMLAGEPTPEPAPYTWAKALSAQQQEQLVMLAMARADILEEQLERLLEDDAPTGANVAAVSQGRADLGSVRALLAAAERADELDEVIVEIDALGARLTDEDRFGGVDFFANERMMRELTVAPEAWWTRRALIR